jgi:hypothetical protein
MAQSTSIGEVMATQETITKDTDGNVVSDVTVTIPDASILIPRVRQALIDLRAANAAYLALTPKTADDVGAQVGALTRQVTAVARHALGDYT